MYFEVIPEAALNDVAQRLTWNVRALLGVLGYCAHREQVPALARLRELVGVLNPRMLRLAKRFRELVLAIRADTNTPPRRRTASRPRPARPAATADGSVAGSGTAPAGQAAPPRLPRKPGWVSRLIWPSAHRHIAGGYACDIQRMLADPELQTMLKTEPRLGRILRALWRMLFNETLPPELALPPRPRPEPSSEPSSEPRPEQSAEHSAKPPRASRRRRVEPVPRWPTHEEVFGPPDSPFLRNMPSSIKVRYLKRPPKDDPKDEPMGEPWDEQTGQPADPATGRPRRPRKQPAPA